MARKEKLINTVLLTGGKLRLVASVGEAALEGQSVQDFAAEVLSAYSELMEFRNMVSSMAAFDQSPKDSVAHFFD